MSKVSAVDTSTVVPNTAHGEVIKGTQAGPLLTPAGRGVVNGVPYGENLRTQAEGLRRFYTFQPAVQARLRAATRSALGR